MFVPRAEMVSLRGRSHTWRVRARCGKHCAAGADAAGGPTDYAATNTYSHHPHCHGKSQEIKAKPRRPVKRGHHCRPERFSDDTAV